MIINEIAYHRKGKKKLVRDFNKKELQHSQQYVRNWNHQDTLDHWNADNGSDELPDSTVNANLQQDVKNKQNLVLFASSWQCFHGFVVEILTNALSQINKIIVPTQLLNIDVKQFVIYRRQSFAQRQSVFIVKLPFGEDEFLE